MKRRGFLKAGAAGVTGAVLGSSGLLTWTPRAEATTITREFYITDGIITQPDGVDVYFRGYSAPTSALDVPGESMIVQEGDTVQITIHNTLSSTHSFVIDGIADTQVNSGSISGGQKATVTFTAKNPGSYLYYDGRNAPYNRLAGLHGAIAVMPSGSSNQLYTGSPTFVQQLFWVFNEIDPAWNNALGNGQTPSGPFVPRYFTINGLQARPPGAAGSGSFAIDAMVNQDTALYGRVGDRTLVRMLNAGLAKHSIHTHGNHMEWLTSNGKVRSHVWFKDIIPLDGNMGKADMIYPFEYPPDAWPPNPSVGVYPMHMHDEMTQTAGGGLYMFGALTDIHFQL